jgi:Transposase DDE domain
MQRWHGNFLTGGLRLNVYIWLDRDMQWFAAPSGKRGRGRTFSDAAIQFCLGIKCLFGLALRQNLGLVESLLRLAGLNWPVPDFSTISRRQQDLKVKLPSRSSRVPLDLLVGSTGIKFLGEGNWKHYDTDYRHVSDGSGAYDTKGMPQGYHAKAGKCLDTTECRTVEGSKCQD